MNAINELLKNIFIPLMSDKKKIYEHCVKKSTHKKINITDRADAFIKCIIWLKSNKILRSDYINNNTDIYTQTINLKSLSTTDNVEIKLLYNFDGFFTQNQYFTTFKYIESNNKFNFNFLVSNIEYESFNKKKQINFYGQDAVKKVDSVQYLDLDCFHGFESKMVKPKKIFKTLTLIISEINRLPKHKRRKFFECCFDNIVFKDLISTGIFLTDKDKEEFFKCFIGFTGFVLDYENFYIRHVSYGANTIQEYANVLDEALDYFNNSDHKRQNGNYNHIYELFLSNLEEKDKDSFRNIIKVVSPNRKKIFEDL